MESFLQMAWEKNNSCVQKVPTDFVLGPLLRGLNDVVHHKDFGQLLRFNCKKKKKSFIDCLTIIHRPFFFEKRWVNVYFCFSF